MWNRMPAFLLLSLVVGACSSEKSTTTGTGAGSAGGGSSATTVVQGTLELSALPTEVTQATDGSFTLSAAQQTVEVKDARDTVVAQGVTSDGGAYSVIVPMGALAVGPVGGPVASLWAPLKSWLLGESSSPPTLAVSSVITRTANKAVVGFRQPLSLNKASGGVLQLGKTPAEKITAIRGQFRLEGGRDHTGIAIYIPGTSYAARTDAAGQFVMTFLQPGTYALRAERDGYLPVNLDAVQVSDRETTVLSEASLRLSGGVGSFRIRQVGQEGRSRERQVTFSIDAGSADRFKGGLASNFENLTYGPVPSEFVVTFPADGTFEVKMAFADADGYETIVSRTIVVDTVPPVATNLHLADRTSGSLSFTNETSVLALHPTCDDIDKIAILPATATAARETDFIWDCRKAVSQADFLFSIPAVEGEFAYRIWARDLVGNTSETPVEGSITLDLTPPSSPVLQLSDFSSGSVRGTDSATVSARMTSCSDIAFIAFSEEMTTRPSPGAFTAPCSTSSNAYSYTFQNSIPGTKRVYVWAMDRAGNFSPTVATAQIELDANPPAAPAFAFLRDSSQVTAGFINDRNPEWAPSSCTDVDALFISNSNSRPAFNEPGWIACDTGAVNTHLLTAGDGTKTVYLWARDAADNVSVSAAQASITLDTTPPVATGLVFTLRDATSGSTSRTNSPAVQYAGPSCGDEVSSFFVTESVLSSPPAASSFSVPCVDWGSYGFAFSPGAFATKTAYFWVRDKAGNVSLSAASDSIAYNETPFVLTVTNTHDTITFATTSDDPVSIVARYGLSDVALTDQVSSSGAQTFQSLNATGLNSGTVYYYRVDATDPVSGSVTSQTGSVKTYYGKSGTVASNESWNATDVPYYLSGNVTVDAAATLTVGPGVSVRFAQNRTFIVNGKIKIMGNSEQRVRLVPHSSDENSAFWSGFAIAATAPNVTVDGSDNYLDGSIIQYADVHGAGSTGDVISLGGATGIYLDNVHFSGIGGQPGSPRAFVKGTFESKVYLRNSTLTGFPYVATYGINIAGGTTGTGVLVVHDNAFLGRSGERQYMVMMGNGPAGGLSGRLSIRRNSFLVGGLNSSNPGAALELYTTAPGAIVAENVMGPADAYQNYYGIRVKAGSLVVEKNAVRMADAGILFEPTGNSVTLDVRKNVLWRTRMPLGGSRSYSDGHTLNISQNALLECAATWSADPDYPYEGSPGVGFGISQYFSNSANINISKNLFSGLSGGGINGSAVNLYQASGKTVTYSVTENAFVGNTTPYLLYAPKAAGTVTATGNYWNGAMTAGAINALNFDGDDNIQRMTLDTGSPSATPPLLAPLTPPGNVQVSRNGTSATVQWNPGIETDLAGYKVYWDDDDGEFPFDGVVQCSGASTASCVVGGLPASGGVTFRVTSYDSGATAPGQAVLTDIWEAKESWYSSPVVSYP